MQPVNLCVESWLLHLWLFRLGSSLLPLSVWEHFMFSSLNFYSYCFFSLSIRRVVSSVFHHFSIVLPIILKCGDVSKMDNIYCEYAFFFFALCKYLCHAKFVQGSVMFFRQKNKAYHESHRPNVISTVSTSISVNVSHYA